MGESKEVSPQKEDDLTCCLEYRALIGNSMKLVDTMKKERVSVACLQKIM